jgi:hypothetical protein
MTVGTATALANHPRLRPWLSRARAYRRQCRLDSQLRAVFETLPNGPSEDQLSQLWHLWGDDLSPSRLPFIRACIAETLRCPGPILQCGGSLASIVIGILCHQADVQKRHLWVLEHDPHWAGVVRSWLERYEISRAHVISAPAEQFDGFVWYVVDPSRLPRDFALVLSDASSALPASAKGVTERVADNLAHRCVILARNARRPRDIKNLAKWAKAQRAPFVIHDAAEPYVKIALRDQRTDADHKQARLNTIYSNQASA